MSSTSHRRYYIFEPEMKESKFTFIDLFAGIGGFRIALEETGGKCIGFSEIAPDAIKAYCDNHNESQDSNFGDICLIQDLPKHDFLTGGVPCQSWSIAGKNLGFDDSRGQLWNDALFLLKKSRPKAFIFENVKGLADPRNKEALAYIMKTIKEAGYYAQFHLLNAFDYGVPQNRVRIYIIGFREERFFLRFRLPQKRQAAMPIVNDCQTAMASSTNPGKQSLSANDDGFNDYFLFNDLRNGATTVHSWDITETTDKEKNICQLLLANRRKKVYGNLDGNPLSINHLIGLDPAITQADIDGLVEKGILKAEKYRFRINRSKLHKELDGYDILCRYDLDHICIDSLKSDRQCKIRKIKAVEMMERLCADGIAECTEVRYDFKNTKISTGLNGINRIFLPTTRVYPTLVASDTNDFITDIRIAGSSSEEYKSNFIREVFEKGRFRRISKEEACMIQGFPRDFRLPEARARWMKLIGNSVAVGLVKALAKCVVDTGVFNEDDYKMPVQRKGGRARQLSIF